MNLADLSTLRDVRWANPENFRAERGAAGQENFGRKGRPYRGELKAGETWTLLDQAGSGTIRQLWITANDRSPEVLRGVVIRCFWDGASTPAIEAPIGDFFGSPLGRMTPFQNVWFDSPEGRSFNCRLPMPFRNGCRIEVENQSSTNIAMFWYDIEFSVGDEHPEGTGYLHAHYRRENLTTLRRDFEVLPRVEGRGRFLGANFGVRVNQEEFGSTWWGEGEVKIFLDGDGEFPTLSGTGTEDYIRTAWGQGEYCMPSYGCTIADSQRAEYAFYRWHDYDAIDFAQEIRVTIQQIGWTTRGIMAGVLSQTGMQEVIVAGDGKTRLTLDDLRASDTDASLMFERRDDWCATAFFYLDRPENNLPPIEEYSARAANLSTVEEIKRADA